MRCGLQAARYQSPSGRFVENQWQAGDSFDDRERSPFGSVWPSCRRGFQRGLQASNSGALCPRGIDTQSVALQTIRRRIVTLEELDTNVGQLQPLRQTQATGARANAHHLARHTNQDSSAALFFIVELAPA